jgi:catechol 2,3-dioxygenase-like lactoylglutathione lyase family enzyme
MIEDTLPFLQSGIAQIALIVPDLEAAVENYWKLFGIGPWHIYTYGKPLVKKMTYYGEEVDYSMRIALSYFGDMRVELIEPGDPPSIYHDFVEAHGYGPHHYGILVEDMEAALAQAEAAGFPMIQDGQGFGADGDGHYAYIDTEDALGMILEFIERPKGRVEPEAIYPPPTEEQT